MDIESDGRLTTLAQHDLQIPAHASYANVNSSRTISKRSRLTSIRPDAIRRKKKKNYADSENAPHVN
eukprot:scaffold16541_cov15-Tisochrysis_lutea.AAC.1